MGSEAVSICFVSLFLKFHLNAIFILSIFIKCFFKRTPRYSL